MIKSLLHILGMLIGWVELASMTLLLFLLSFVPGACRCPIYRRLFRFWAGIWQHAFGLQVHLHQHAPLPEHYLLIANHPSAFEDVGIPSFYPVDSLAKQSLRKWFLVGRISDCAGTLFVERQSFVSRRRAALGIINRLKAGHNVALYPEGGVFSHRVHDAFHSGVFHISLSTGIPIVPVFIHYEAQLAFHWNNTSVIEHCWNIMRSPNKRANYHQYAAFNPSDFSDKHAYREHVYAMYKAWEQQYLD